MPSISPTPNLPQEAKGLTIQPLPPPATPLPRMSAPHHPIHIKCDDRPDLSPTQLLPALPALLHRSTTTSTRRSTPLSPFITVGLHTSLFRPNSLHVSSPMDSSPSPCRRSEIQWQVRWRIDRGRAWDLHVAGMKSVVHGMKSVVLPSLVHGGLSHLGPWNDETGSGNCVGKTISRKTSLNATFCNKVLAFTLILILSNEYIVTSHQSLNFTWSTLIFTLITFSSQILTQEPRKMFTRCLHIFLLCIQILHIIFIGNIQINFSFGFV
jgi:hypothetical protein